MLVVPSEDLALVRIVGELHQVLEGHGEMDLRRGERQIRVDIVDDVDVRLLLVVVLHAVEDAVGDERLTETRRIVGQDPGFLRVQRVGVDFRGEKVSRLLLAVENPEAVLVNGEIVPARLRRVVEWLASGIDLHLLAFGFRDEIETNDGVLVLDVVDETALVDHVIDARVRVRQGDDPVRLVVDQIGFAVVLVEQRAGNVPREIDLLSAVRCARHRIFEPGAEGVVVLFEKNRSADEREDTSWASVEGSRDARGDQRSLTLSTTENSCGFRWKRLDIGGTLAHLPSRFDESARREKR